MDGSPELALLWNKDHVTCQLTNRAPLFRFCIEVIATSEDVAPGAPSPRLELLGDASVGLVQTIGLSSAQRWNGALRGVKSRAFRAARSQVQGFLEPHL